MGERAFKREGLILRSRTLGEADRVLTILSRESGKFEAVARGARKTKSKLAAGVDLFCHGRFQLHRGKTWPVVTGQDPIGHFYHFRNDYTLYPYGLYLAELTDRLVSGEEPCPEIYELLLTGWRLLGENPDRSFLCRAFELKLARAAGYSPHLDGCVSCKSREAFLFSPRQGGLVCPGCRAVDLIRLEPGTIAVARRLLQAPLAELSRLKPSARQKEELARLNTAFLTFHLDLGQLKSRRLLAD